MKDESRNFHFSSVFGGEVLMFVEAFFVGGLWGKVAKPLAACDN